MFTADLSWTDPTDEKVGQRKERKSKENSFPPKTPSIKSSKSSTQESVWRPSFKITRLRSTKAVTTEKANGSHETYQNKKLPKLPPQPLDFSLKDPTLQPAWSFSSTLSPSLRSGTSIGLPGSTIPGPEYEPSSPSSRKSYSSWSCYSGGFGISAEPS